MDRGLQSLIELAPVESSNIEAVGFDPSTGELHVKTKGGGIYIYKDVPKSAHENLMAAGSIGSYFAKHIRGKYDFRRPE